MLLPNNIFNIDMIKINQVNKRYLKISLITLVILVSVLVIKKEYYYENNMLINDNNVILLVEKKFINQVRNKKSIQINEIKSDYSINKIINQKDFYYVDIDLHTNIENISDTKYKILLGKETIFEYIIRIIKKIS